jgi:hypothetical protein
MRKLPLPLAMLLFGLFPSTFAESSPSLEGINLNKEQALRVRYVDLGTSFRHITQIDIVKNHGEELWESSIPQSIEEYQQPSAGRIVELIGNDVTLIRELLQERQVKGKPKASQQDFIDEVMTLVDNGPSDNRIDLVFMGDGYTSEQREQFFADMVRLVDDMFRGETFRAYLPLFNVHAVFRPSRESGIGTDDRPRDTAYGLYRPGKTLRAIYPSKRAAARASCAQAPGCDYPVLIANDPHYGGLGGEFAISTSSLTSGTVVLRHELGHNFGRVGEEYDGGGYFGANHSSSLSGIKWTHWLSDDPQNLNAQGSVARFLAWPWHNLNGGPYNASFTSDGSRAFAALRYSVSGLPDDRDLSIELDGQEISFPSRGNEDRNFYNHSFAQGFTAGQHRLTFRENTTDDNNWVSSLTIHEYSADYRFEEDYVGAYPLYSSAGNVAGYRSNHERCLMRNMQSQKFCDVCQENNWRKFLGQVRIIDSLQVLNRKNSAVHVKLNAIPLPPSGNDQSSALLKISWHRDGEEVPALEDTLEWSLPQRDASGHWRAVVRLETPEVRSDPNGVLVDEAEILVTAGDGAL